MARGRKPINIKPSVEVEEKQEKQLEDKKYICLYCNSDKLTSKDIYIPSKNNVFFKRLGYIPFCKNCIIKMYDYYKNLYEINGVMYPEQRAIRRVCMGLNIFYSDNLFNSAFKAASNKQSIMSSYLRISNLSQYQNNGYDTTFEKDEHNFDLDCYAGRKTDEKIKQKTTKFFGNGFKDEDYLFLQEQYDDWTARHECKTKAQEEVFKQICFTQLELLKATRAGDDTKDLTATFQKLLDTAKLQPKQNSGDTTSDNQTFGTLIDKWENTRPLPEIEEPLRDVDKIGRYIDVFFRGHLAKMMGMKNGLSNLYTKFISKYTVSKPEYTDDENSEVIFDAIFGNHLDNDDTATNVNNNIDNFIDKNGGD